MNRREDSVMVRLERLESAVARARDDLSLGLVRGTLSFIDFQRSSADLDRGYRLRMRNILASV